MVPGNVRHNTFQVQLSSLDPPVIQTVDTVAGQERGRFKNTNLGIIVIGKVSYYFFSYLIFICHCDFSCVIGDIDTSDLDIVVTNAGDDLDAVEVIGEDDDVTSSSVGYQGYSLHRSNTE